MKNNFGLKDFQCLASRNPKRILDVSVTYAVGFYFGSRKSPSNTKFPAHNGRQVREL
jgi:hypothetical protein